MNTQGRDETLEFTPFLKRGEKFSKIMLKNRSTPYQVALFGLDLTVASLFFLLDSRITGLNFFVAENLSQFAFLFIFMIIAFFFAYNLYSYHLIFSVKKHLINLFKSLGWCLLTYGIIEFIYVRHIFDDSKYIVPFMMLIAIVLLLPSKIFWKHINLLKDMGTSFLVTGIAGLVIVKSKKIDFTYSLTVHTGFFLAVGMVLASRNVLVHVVFNIWMRRHYRRQLAIVGSDQEAKRISAHIIEHNAPFWITGFVGSECALMGDISKDYLGQVMELPDIVRKNQIEEIIVTDEHIDKRTLVALLDYCISKGLTVWFSPKSMPIIDTKLNIDKFCGLPMIRLCSQKNSWLFGKIKYGLDALIALPLFVLLLPVFMMIAVAIKLNSEGPVFYRAEAVGKNGRNFAMYKFRSMRVNNSFEIHRNYVTKLIKGEIYNDGKKDQPLKITDDPRITSVGKFLRKFSLDELPQLINVLKGDMSLVGPRPCLPYEYEIYEDWHKKRACVRPGISGLWQVVGRSAVKFEDMILLDLYYIYNRSLLLDLNILFKTVFAVIDKRGAY